MINDAEFFDYRCPYTDKRCYDWDCDTCEVEEEEREDMEKVDLNNKNYPG